MKRTTPRTCRKARWCDTCNGPIPAGHAYLEHVASPYHDDLGNVGWWRMDECYVCAWRCDRWDLMVGHPGEREASYAAYIGGCA